MKKLIVVAIVCMASIGSQILSMGVKVKAQQLANRYKNISTIEDKQKYHKEFTAIYEGFGELLGSAQTLDEYQQIFEIFNENVSDLRSPLTTAAGYGNTKIVAILLKDGDPDKLDKIGETALMVAASQGHKEVVELLLKAGSDPNIKISQSTALMTAAFKGHKEVVELLLKHGADPSLKSLDGYTAKAYAQKKYPEIAELL